MNADCFKLIFVRRSEQLTPVAEFVSRSGKCLGERVGRVGPVRRQFAALLLAGLCGGWAHAQLPSGGAIVSGSGAISPQGTQLLIQQNTPRLGIDWQSFSIGAGNRVVFAQPDAAAIALNRVIGHSRSEIYGAIQANGQVFLINPNGILFGRSAEINVGGLLASTKMLSPEDFAQGIYRLTGTDLSADIINQGTLKALPGGTLVFVGDRLTNTGQIIAQGGKVIMAAGQSATLSLDHNGHYRVDVDGPVLGALVDNQGLISADNGSVWLTTRGKYLALDNAINMSGSIFARSGTVVLDGGNAGITQLQGGTIDVSSANATGGSAILAGQYVGLFNNATINASGAVGGGKVIIGGDQLGKVASTLCITLAEQTYIDQLAHIDISSSEGDGGFIETSGKGVNIAGTLLAQAKGKSGQWLIDPNDITIQNAVNSAISGTTIWTGDSTTATSTVSNTALGSALTSGASIEIRTNGSGNITVSDDVFYMGSGNLTLNAGTNILVDAHITGITGIDSGLTLTSGGGTQISGNINISGDLNINSNGSFYNNVNSITAGNINIKTGNTANNSLWGIYINGGNLTANQGNINFDGKVVVAGESQMNALNTIHFKSSLESGTIIFTDIGNWRYVSSQDSFQYVIVGGGGAGGKNTVSSNYGGGGGGGAGGYLNGTINGAASNYSIIVGAGGNGNSKSGGNSSLGNIIAYGGGGGAGGGNAPSGTWGSGGGGSGTNNDFTSAATGTSGQGNRGGNGGKSSNSWSAGGGGGGAGGPGSTGTLSGASGGTGVTNNLIPDQIFAAGGTGGSSQTGNGANASANTGSGGGGTDAGTVGFGGSGVVAVRNVEAANLTLHAQNVTIDGVISNTANAFKVLTINSSAVGGTGRVGGEAIYYHNILNDPLQYWGLGISSGSNFYKEANTHLVFFGNSSGGTLWNPSGSLQLTDYLVNGNTIDTTIDRVENSGELLFNQTANITISGVIAGTGNLTQSGSGRTILTGNNTINGTVTITDGILQIGNGGANGSLSNNIIYNDSEFVVNRKNAINYNYTVIGNGNVTLVGKGVQIESDVNIGGNLFINSTGSFYNDNNAIVANNIYIKTAAYSSSSPYAIYLNGGHLSARGGDLTLANKVFAAGALTLKAENAIHFEDTLESGAITFTDAGQWRYTALSDAARYLIIGGGGSGGKGGAAYGGGGGGAGGILECMSSALTLGSSYAVVVGSGGASTSTQGGGYSGEDSIFNGLVALGGGAGGGPTYGGGGTAGSGASGGGAGGAGSSSGIINFGGSASQGYSGGNLIANTVAHGAGGGGAGGAGGNANTTAAGVGGAGSSSNITGLDIIYARGGAGAKKASTTAPASIASTGSGGSGSSNSSSGAGSSGVVAIRNDTQANVSLTANHISFLANVSNNPNNTINVLTITNANVSGSGTLIAREIVANQTMGESTWSVAIAGASNFSKIGAQNLTLGATNYYTGNTTISEGQLYTAASDALGKTGTSNLTIAEGAILNIGTFAQNIGSLSGKGHVTGSQMLTIGANALNTTFGGVALGALSLNKIGTGTILLTADHNYSGTTTISNGWLAVGNGSAAGTLGSGNITNNATLTYNRSDDVNLVNNVSGSGKLNITAGANVNISQSVSQGNITLIAGNGQEAGDASGGEILLGGNLNASTLTIVTGNSSNINTSALQAKIKINGSAVTAEKTEKWYNADMNSMNQASAGQFNLFYRYAACVTTNGGSASRTYDGTNVVNATINAFTGIDGDQFDATTKEGVIDSSHAGERTVIALSSTSDVLTANTAVSGATAAKVHGLQFDNSSNAITANIAQRVVNITAQSATKTYDGTVITDVVATYGTQNANGGFLSGDNISYAQVFNNTHVLGDSGSSVTLANGSLTSNSTYQSWDSDYNISVVSNTGTITQRVVNATFSNFTDKTFDFTNNTLAPNYTLAAAEYDGGGNLTSTSGLITADQGGNIGLCYSAAFNQAGAGENLSVNLYGVNATTTNPANDGDSGSAQSYLSDYDIRILNSTGAVLQSNLTDTVVDNIDAVGKATIKKAVVTFTHNGSVYDKVYDKTTNAALNVSATYNVDFGDKTGGSGTTQVAYNASGNANNSGYNLADGNVVNTSATTTQFQNGSAGTQTANISYFLKDDANFTFSATDNTARQSNVTTTATIAQAVVSVTQNATVHDKTYDKTANAAVNASAVYSVALGNASVAKSGYWSNQSDVQDGNVSASAVFTNASAGTQSAALTYSLNNSVFDATNYSLAANTGTTTANIKKAQVFITGNGTVADKVYDGTTNASVSTAPNVTIAYGDSNHQGLTAAATPYSAVNISAQFASEHAAPSVDALISVILQDSANTSLASDGSSLNTRSLSTQAAINPRDLIVTATAQDKAIDGSTASSQSATATGWANRDSAASGGLSQSFAQSEAGATRINAAPLSNASIQGGGWASDYNVSYIDAPGNITAILPTTTSAASAGLASGISESQVLSSLPAETQVQLLEAAETNINTVTNPPAPITVASVPPPAAVTTSSSVVVVGGGSSVGDSAIASLASSSPTSSPTTQTAQSPSTASTPTPATDSSPPSSSPTVESSAPQTINFEAPAAGLPLEDAAPASSTPTPATESSAPQSSSTPAAESSSAAASEASAKSETAQSGASSSGGAATEATFAPRDLSSMSQDEAKTWIAEKHEAKTQSLSAGLEELETNPQLANLLPCSKASAGEECVPDAKKKPKLSRAQALARDKSPGVRRALLIGINEYKDSGIPRLASALNDVNAIAQVLKNNLGYTPQVLSNPTRQQIIQALVETAQGANPNDSVIVYYAGHGYFSDKLNSGFWLPSSADTKNPRTWLANSDISQLVKSIDAKQVLLVSDSCYSGSLVEYENDPKAVQQALARADRSLVVISSGGDEPVSDEGRDNHSIFAWHFIEAMKNSNFSQTSVDLYEKVREEVTKSFPQTPRYGVGKVGTHQKADGQYRLRDDPAKADQSKKRAGVT
jgi:fibronectin-binding autotransporter adhesin